MPNNHHLLEKGLLFLSAVVVLSLAFSYFNWGGSAIDIAYLNTSTKKVPEVIKNENKEVEVSIKGKVVGLKGNTKSVVRLVIGENTKQEVNVDSDGTFRFNPIDTKIGEMVTLKVEGDDYFYFPQEKRFQVSQNSYNVEFGSYKVE